VRGQIGREVPLLGQRVEEAVVVVHCRGSSCNGAPRSRPSPAPEGHPRESAALQPRLTTAGTSRMDTTAASPHITTSHVARERKLAVPSSIETLRLLSC